MRSPRGSVATLVAFAVLSCPPAAAAVRGAPPGTVAQEPAVVGLGGGQQGPMGGRSGGRRTVAKAHARAIGLGLEWLQANQREDGSWAPAPDIDAAARRSATISVTSAALLAMLGDGSTMRGGPCKEQIKLAVIMLRDLQRTDGSFLPRDAPGFAAAQAAATLAMTEACVLSSYNVLKKSAERGLGALAGMRTADGGWCATDGATASDPSLTLWCAMTYLAARNSGFDLPVEDAARTAQWLQGPAALRVPDRGPLGLPAPLGREPWLRDEQAAANALCGHLVGAAARGHAASALERARRGVREWTAERAGSMFEWCCSAHALWQAGAGEAVTAIGDALVAAQVADGEHAGSWAPHGLWGDVGGRAWTTAMALLTLEAPYRYVRLRR